MGGAYFSQRTSRGYNLGEVVSALQKSIRRGDEAQATWWAAELDRSGFCRSLWQRLETIVTEDVGPCWPEGLVVMRLMKARWEEELSLGDRGYGARCYPQLATMLLARAPKSRRLTHAILANYGAPGRRFEIPDYALDKHTARGKRMGRGLEHFEAEAAKLVNEADLGPDPYREIYLAIDGKENEWDVQVKPNQPKRARSENMARLFSVSVMVAAMGVVATMARSAGIG